MNPIDLCDKIEIRFLLAPAQARSYSASYRAHHVAFMSKISSFLFPSLLPDKANQVPKSPAKSLPEILACRTFSHSYRERQFAPLMACIPKKRFIRGSRHINSIPLLTHLTESEGAARNKSRRMRLLRYFGAGLIVYLAFQFLNQENHILCLNQLTYVPFELVKIEPISPTTSIFTLHSKSDESIDGLVPISAVSIKEPNSNIQRPYTVLSVDDSTIKVMIKRYEGGELSRYVHSRKIGSEILIRKAPSDYTLPREHPKRYMLVVGGTGVAIAYQIATYISKVPQSERPSIALLYSSLSPAEVYLRSEFDVLKKLLGKDLSIRHYIDSEKTFLSVDDLQEEQRDGTVTLVCGSDGFVAFVAGKKPEHEGQGEIGGLLQVANIVDNVWKL